jgi:arylsulfatase A-like enzyme
MVSLDTLRADHVSCLGYKQSITPNLDRLASEGALFSQAISADIPTQPAHTALFTGRFGLNTGIVSHFHPPATLDPGVDWLPSIMQAQGCRTGAVDHLFVMKDWFVRGYQDYMVPAGRSRAPASVVNAMAFPWIEQHASQDFFLFLHFWDAHIPYVPPSPFLETHTAESATWDDPAVTHKLVSRPSYPLFKRTHYDFLSEIPNLQYLASLYDAEIAYLDYELGNLLRYLEHLGVLVRVPLIIRFPPRVPPVRVDAMVSHVDLLPTVLEMLDLPVPNGLDGRSLMPVIRQERPDHRDAVMLSECTWQAKRGIRTSKWKFIRCYHPGIYASPEIELYDLARDPDEQHNVAHKHPGVVAQLSGQLDAWIRDLLDGRPDPMVEVIEFGLPAVRRLEKVVLEDGYGLPETLPA